ncbi:MAG: DNA primase [bacterium]|nr:DNA primase [bacterium]
MNRDQIEQVLSNIDIVDIVNDYLALKKNGSNFKGLCPFHNEKTPSFVVSQDKQIFHCFGCHEGGDALSFLLKIENLTFPEALKILAEKAGVKLNFTKNDTQFESQKNNLYDINNRVSEYYHKCLEKSPKAKKYLKTRELDDEIIKIFKIGFANEEFDSLLRVALKHRIDTKLLEQVGLLKKNKINKLNDWFIDRIMFPIADVRGRVIAFGGRVLSDGMPKYLNSPETKIFKKSSILYNLHNAVQHIKEKSQVLVLEGYMDVISLYANGFKNTVATLGTALTNEHIKHLKRYTNNIILLFDGDDAGVKASLRSVDIFLKYSLNVKIVLIPEKLDPDDYLKKYNSEKFQMLIHNAENAFEYKINILAKNKNLHDLHDREVIISKVFEMLSNINDRLKLNSMFRIIADRINDNESDIRFEFNKFLKKSKKNQKTRNASLKNKKNILSNPSHSYILIECKFLEFLINYPNEINSAKKLIKLDWITSKNISKIIEYMFYNCERLSLKSPSEILREAVSAVPDEKDRSILYKNLINSILKKPVHVEITIFKDELEAFYIRKNMKNLSKTKDDLKKRLEALKKLEGRA